MTVRSINDATARQWSEWWDGPADLKRDVSVTCGAIGVIGALFIIAWAFDTYPWVTGPTGLALAYALHYVARLGLDAERAWRDYVPECRRVRTLDIQTVAVHSTRGTRESGMVTRVVATVKRRDGIERWAGQRVEVNGRGWPCLRVDDHPVIRDSVVLTLSEAPCDPY